MIESKEEPRKGTCRTCLYAILMTEDGDIVMRCGLDRRHVRPWDTCRDWRGSI